MVEINTFQHSPKKQQQQQKQNQAVTLLPINTFY